LTLLLSGVADGDVVDQDRFVAETFIAAFMRASERFEAVMDGARVSFEVVFLRKG
jgi:hypothetical protein